MPSFHIPIIVGSIRPNRIGREVSQWVLNRIQGLVDLQFELVDLKDWNLPLSDEPGIPAKDDYLYEHTRAWSRKIAVGDGFVFVTPQYNWGYPASLKNAIDHLYKEWKGKPFVIISYGYHGGSKAAAQLKQVCEGLQMRSAETMPALTITEDMFDPTGRPKDLVKDFAPFVSTLLKAIDEFSILLKESGGAHESR